jgi:hypothetical protein
VRLYNFIRSRGQGERQIRPDADENGDEEEAVEKDSAKVRAEKAIYSRMVERCRLNR